MLVSVVLVCQLGWKILEIILLFEGLKKNKKEEEEKERGEV